MKSRFTEEEIHRIVQTSRTEGIAEVAHKHNISEQTLYNWRKRFRIAESLTPSGELTRLQQENARLKRLVAERDLEIDLLKETAERNGTSVMDRLELKPSTPWSEATRSAAFTGAYDEVDTGDKP